MKKPKVIHWAITSKCNMSCGFCFAFMGKELSTKKCLKIVDKLSDLKIKKLVITGGEPLVKKDIIKILKYAALKGFKIRLDTNGILLPRYMKKLNFIDGIGISLDGPTAETDQKMRHHPNHFENVIKSLDYFNNKKNKIIIHTLVTRLNYRDIYKMPSLLKKYKIHKWSIFEFCPYSRGFTNKKRYELPKSTFNRLRSKINYPRKIDFCKVSNRVKAYFFITSDGYIYTQPRNFSKNYPIWGNVFIDNVEDFFQNIKLDKNFDRSRVY